MPRINSFRRRIRPRWISQGKQTPPRRRVLLHIFTKTIVSNHVLYRHANASAMCTRGGWGRLVKYASIDNSTNYPWARFLPRLFDDIHVTPRDRESLSVALSIGTRPDVTVQINHAVARLAMSQKRPSKTENGARKRCMFLVVGTRRQRRRFSCEHCDSRVSHEESTSSLLRLISGKLMIGGVEGRLRNLSYSVSLVGDWLVES